MLTYGNRSPIGSKCHPSDQTRRVCLHYSFCDPSPTGKAPSRHHDRNSAHDLANASTGTRRAPVPFLAEYCLVRADERRQPKRRCRRSVARQLFLRRPGLVFAVVHPRHRWDVPNIRHVNPYGSAAACSGVCTRAGAGGWRDGLAFPRLELTGWPGGRGRATRHTFTTIPTMKLKVCIASILLHSLRDGLFHHIYSAALMPTLGFRFYWMYIIDLCVVLS